MEYYQKAQEQKKPEENKKSIEELLEKTDALFPDYEVKRITKMWGFIRR